MIWDILINKIEGANLAQEGFDLFEQRMPADQPKCIGLFAPLDGVKISPHLPGLYKPNLKVIVRHNEIVAGQALAKRVMELLTIEGEETYEANSERGRVVLKVFYPLTLPIQFPAQVGNSTEWSINFQTAFTINGG